jgi:hypothetical protein
MSVRLSLGLALAATVLAGAGACSEPAPPDGPAITSGVVRKEIPVSWGINVDLLFVIDNSPGIAPQRARLLESFRGYVAVLESLHGGLPDVHIGVVTTDVGTRGAYDAGPGPSIGTGAGSCTSDGDRGELRRAAAIDGNFLSDVAGADGRRQRNYTGSLADAFVQLADVGAAGCAYPRPLQAMRRALVGNPANAGFLREDALLVVVLLTNDDDCSFGSASFVGDDLDRSRCTTDAGSLVAIDEYVGTLQSLKPDPGHVIVLGGFALPDEPPCADARPAPRLAAFVDGPPPRGLAASICEPDLSAPLAVIGQLYRTSFASPCFSVPVLDVDPAADGLQVDCASWYSYRDRDTSVEEHIPACRGDAPGPCWQVRPDPVNCLGEGELADFRDQRRFAHNSNALAIIECVSR